MLQIEQFKRLITYLKEISSKKWKLGFMILGVILGGGVFQKLDYFHIDLVPTQKYNVGLAYYSNDSEQFAIYAAQDSRFKSELGQIILSVNNKPVSMFRNTSLPIFFDYENPLIIEIVYKGTESKLEITPKITIIPEFPLQEGINYIRLEIFVNNEYNLYKRIIINDTLLVTNGEITQAQREKVFVDENVVELYI